MRLKGGFGRQKKISIPTRYPNGLPDLTPGQSYQESDVEIALSAAEKIIRVIIKLIRT